MFGKFSFFSINKQSDWERGWGINIDISNQGLKLKRRIIRENAMHLGEDYSGLVHGTYYSCSLDSTEAETVWHKIKIMESSLLNMHFSISYFASDSNRFNAAGIFSEEDKYSDVDEFICNKEIEPFEKTVMLEKLWGKWRNTSQNDAVADAQDFLMQKAKGRYLWFKIDIKGVETEYPVLRRLRVYFPRMSYLSYLPAAYSQDENSADFLERFLSIFGTFFMEMEESIDNISRYFDPDTVSGEFLEWLSTWLAVSKEESWSEERLRLLIKKAPEIYKRRGTKWAIAEIIELYTGERPYVIEYFEIKKLEEMPLYRELAKQLYGMDPYSFCVIISPKAGSTVQKRLAVQKILDEEKPAFTEAKLVVMSPWIYLNSHTYLGINTFLPEFSSLRLDPDAMVLYNNRLTDENEEKKKAEDDEQSKE